MNETELKTLHKESSNHREVLNKRLLCGCFFCCKTYHPSEIKEWTDAQQTALCPKCGVDSVIPLAVGGPDNKTILEEMFEYWFNRGVSYQMKDGEVASKTDWSGRLKPGGGLKEGTKYSKGGCKIPNKKKILYR